MKERINISFLVGAGFSKAAAGLPLVSELSKSILTELNNGHHYYHPLAIWQSGDSLVEARDFDVAIIRPIFDRFLQEPETFNYEEFYSKLEIEKPKLRRLIQEFIQYRIKAELEISNQEVPNWILKFKDFLVKLVNGGSCVNIASLNHDLFLEGLLSDVNLFSDGFAINNNHPFRIKKTENPSEPDREIAVPIFGDENWKKLNLLKLHGSIDLYSVGNDETFFKCDFHPHRATDNRINFNPIFVTGAKSQRLYFEHNYIKSLTKKLSQDLLETAVIFVIGYGFGDEIVNKILLKNASNKVL